MREEYGDERRTPHRRARSRAGDRRNRAGRERAGHGRAVASAAGCARRRDTISIRATLSYKTGDAFQAAARGRSTQQAVFLDSTGRAYSLAAHSLPSARGQGEPLSGRLDPPDGATFAGVLIGEPDDRWLLASRRRLRLHRAARRAAFAQSRRQGGAEGAGRQRRARAGAGAGRRGRAAVRGEHRGQDAGVPGEGAAGAAARQGQQDVRPSVEEGREPRGIPGRHRGRRAGAEPHRAVAASAR